MAKDSAKPRITLHPHNRRVQIKLGDTLLAEISSAIKLHERGYPLRHYLPRKEVRSEWLSRSYKVIRYPYKGRMQVNIPYSSPFCWSVSGSYRLFSVSRFDHFIFKAMQLPPLLS